MSPNMQLGGNVENQLCLTSWYKLVWAFYKALLFVFMYLTISTWKVSISKLIYFKFWTKIQYI